MFPFFTTTMPVLDELIRFFRFKNSAGFVPPSFPQELPTVFLHGHIIFPATSIICFLMGSLLYVVYQAWFHLWATVKPTDVAEFCQEDKKDSKVGIDNDGSCFEMK